MLLLCKPSHTINNNNTHTHRDHPYFYHFCCTTNFKWILQKNWWVHYHHFFPCSQISVVVLFQEFFYPGLIMRLFYALCQKIIAKTHRLPQSAAHVAIDKIKLLHDSVVWLSGPRLDFISTNEAQPKKP